MRTHGLALLSALFVAPAALAQAPGPSDAPMAPATPAPQAAPAPIVTSPGPAGGVILTPITGVNPNAGLPSSSRPKTGNESDSFDLGNRTGGPAVVGNPGGSAVIADSAGSRALSVPSIHLVRRGDTLWDLSGHYYGNPWQWPRIWSQNPQVENPHWIYPGDQLRLQPGDGTGSLYDRLGSGRGGSGRNGITRRPGLVDERQSLAKGTLVLRDQGFIGDPDTDVWGEIAGAVEEQMLLSEGNHVYLLLKPGKTVKPGEELTLFRTLRQPKDVPGARTPPGEIVAVLGTVKLESVDPKNNMARAKITESVNVIERGARVGPVRRRFDIVPPLKNTANVSARVLTSLYPHVFLAQNQVVFLDHGSQDGLKPGNRMFVQRRGDAWRQSLTAKMNGDRLRTDAPEAVLVERTPLRGENEKFPQEIVGELRILTTERYSSLALVVQSIREVVPGDLVVARAGE